MGDKVLLIEDGIPRNNEWSHGLFGGSADCGEMLLVWFCPCVTFGLNVRDSCYPGYWCDGCCGAFCGCLGFIFCFPVAMCAWGLSLRPKIRRDYGIQGDRYLDWLAVLVCFRCALLQERQQLKESLPSTTQVVVQQQQQNPIIAVPQSYAPPQQYAPQQYAPQQYAPQQYAPGVPHQY